MDKLYPRLLDALREDETVAVATVIVTHGSTPREVGAKMLVRRSGSIVGTVGGGCGEAEVWRTALQVMETGETQVVLVDLSGEVSLDAAAVCGGSMEVLVERWSAEELSPGSPSDLEVAAIIGDRLARREPSVLATVVAAEAGASCRPGDRVVVGRPGLILGRLGSADLDGALEREAGRALQADRGRPVAEVVLGDSRGGSDPFAVVRVRLEVVGAPQRLVIVGGGHIAVPLASLGRMLDFTVAVLDDRASFANRERFPEADVVLAREFAQGLREVGIDHDSYVVLVTRGHQHDVECLRELVLTEVAYLGMIGSRRRVRGVFELLRQEGVPTERLASIHAPIGIDIGAQTPAEIAVSIAAEIVKVRRGGRAAFLADQPPGDG